MAKILHNEKACGYDQQKDPVLFEKLLTHCKQWFAITPPMGEAPESVSVGTPTIGELQPFTVNRSPESAGLAEEFRRECHSRATETAVTGRDSASAWGRQNEMMCQFELLIFGSATSDYTKLVTVEQTQWAIDLTRAAIRAKTERMENKPITDNEFLDRCKWVTNRLYYYEAQGMKRVLYSRLVRDYRLNIKELDEAIYNLEQQKVVFTSRCFNQYGRSVASKMSFVCFARHRGDAVKLSRIKE